MRSQGGPDGLCLIRAIATKHASALLEYFGSLCMSQSLYLVEQRVKTERLSTMVATYEQDQASRERFHALLRKLDRAVHAGRDERTFRPSLECEHAAASTVRTPTHALVATNFHKKQCTSRPSSCCWSRRKSCGARRSVLPRWRRSLFASRSSWLW